MKILVAYYSKTGNTKYIAEILAKELKADLLEIKRKNDIKSSGFMLYFKGGFQSMTKQKSKLEELGKNLSNYDLIVLGAPVWAWRVHPAIRGLIAKENLANKKIALFNSCSGEGNGLKVAEMTKELLKDSLVISEAEFIDPLINKKEEQEKKAKEWAKEIKKVK
ncbi:MAG: flavodoxin family protein [Candidatus Thorarchaeota archaeon]